MWLRAVRTGEAVAMRGGRHDALQRVEAGTQLASRAALGCRGGAGEEGGAGQNFGKRGRRGEGRRHDR